MDEKHKTFGKNSKFLKRKVCRQKKVTLFEVNFGLNKLDGKKIVKLNELDVAYKSMMDGIISQNQI